ncbi:hypothetical protein GGE45_005303 [Rhizobium aethiopicum]|uniref:Uncharacterized protein n=2 Tax=Rhizobium TaxID=379 RepID=A0A7W6MJU6_9HYPH|nr:MULTISPECIES: hypothetical protein [Rhizobium]ARO26627.1 Clp protease family protein [Rhizobium sp. TAL182]MBB4193242.1 hypothetical protein [Rhizobium aethiopicum]MBB4582940.1 hypothetical protein [Rhizobium aethiopicum]PDS94176.1 hypothetical protein CO659_30440 [Rhizobium sp. S9]PDT19203.1 hypothetical protein CO674_34400 [Rhizobium hidalgonense]
MRSSVFISCLILLAALIPSPSHAVIRFAHVKAANNDILLVQGTFEPSDRPEKLEAEIENSIPRFIAFNSPGGDTDAAIGYGRAIRRLKLSTLQVSGSKCEAACLFAFAGGVQRFAEDASVIVDRTLFSPGSSGQQTGTDRYKAYLAEMGLDPSLFTFVTGLADGDRRVLSLIDMAGFGLVTGQPTPYAAPTAEETAVSNELPSTALNDAALQFFQEMQRTWSTNEGMFFLANNYGDSIVYYGTQRSKADVLNEKQQFAERWPVRIYAVRSGTANAACFDICTVFAVVDWYTYSPSRKKSASGAVNAVMTWDPATHKILAENGKITTKDNSVAGPDRIIRRWLTDNAACSLSYAEDACNSQALLLTELTNSGWCRKPDATWGPCNPQ